MRSSLFKKNEIKEKRKIEAIPQGDETERVDNGVNPEEFKQIAEDIKSNSFNEDEEFNLNCTVVFTFENKTKLSYELKSVIQFCPSIPKYVNFLGFSPEEINIILPGWINSQNLEEYFLYIKDEISSFNLSERKLLYIAEFFDNSEIMKRIIYTDIIQSIDFTNALSFLEDSFNKITSSSNEMSACWFDLFYMCISFIQSNFEQYLEKEYILISEINSSVLEEIIEKYSSLT